MKYILLILFILIAPRMTAQEQLKNGGFEQWKDSAGTKFPLHWSVDMYTSLIRGPSDSAAEGKKALVLSTWYNYVEGSLFYGDHQRPFKARWMNYAVPFNDKPGKLTGMYRYTHPVNETDSAGGKILIKDAAGDTLAYGEVLLDTSANWTAFEIPLKYFSKKKASSIVIYFTSRERGHGLNEDTNPNCLFLDDLELVYRKNEND